MEGPVPVEGLTLLVEPEVFACCYPLKVGYCSDSYGVYYSRSAPTVKDSLRAGQGELPLVSIGVSPGVDTTLAYTLCDGVIHTPDKVKLL